MILGGEFKSYRAEETLNGRDDNSGIFWVNMKGLDWHPGAGDLDESVFRVRWEYARHNGDGTGRTRRGKWAREREYEGRIIGKCQCNRLS